MEHRALTNAIRVQLLVIAATIVSIGATGCRQDYAVLATYKAEPLHAGPVYILKGKAVLRSTQDEVEVIRRNGTGSRLRLPRGTRLDVSGSSIVASGDRHVLYCITTSTGSVMTERTAVYELDVATGEHHLIRKLAGVVREAAYSPKGDTLVVVTRRWSRSALGESCQLAVSSYGREAAGWRQLWAGGGCAKLCNWSADGKIVYCILQDGRSSSSVTALSLDGAGIRTVRRGIDLTTSIYGAYVLPGEKQMVIGRKGGLVSVLDLRSSRVTKLMTVPDTGVPFPIAANPSSDLIAAGFERMKNGRRPVTGMGFHIVKPATRATKEYRVRVGKDRYPHLSFLQWHPTEPKFIAYYQTSQWVQIREYTADLP